MTSTRGNPFATTGDWLRASVHNHTVASDGSQSVHDLCAWYQDQGMDVVVITDHDVVADVSEAADLDIAVLPGAEIAVCWDEAYGAEVLALGIDNVRRKGIHPQDVIDDVLEQGGLPYISHPHLSGVYSGLLMPLDGLVGIETYNAGGVGMGNRGVANIHHDDLTTAGKIVWGLATDDRHAVSDAPPQGWIEVRAASSARDDVIAAIRDGFYYSTTGPRIDDIAFSDTHITIKCSPAQRLTLSTLPWLSKKVDAGDEPLTTVSMPLDAIGTPASVAAFTQRLVDQDMMSAPRPIAPHVRIEIDDGHGGFAWSNPIAIMG